MKSLWSYFENHFTPEECDIISLKCLNNGIKNGFEDGGLGHEGKVNTDIRSCRIVHIGAEDMPDVFQKIIEAVEGANRVWFGGFEISQLKGMDFTEYDVKYKGKYTEHIDVMWTNKDSNRDENPVHRKISFTLQLSDPTTYDDGNLVLNANDVMDSGQPDLENIRQQGTLTVFPSWVRHKVTPITRGTRYALVGWVEGPTWK